MKQRQQLELPLPVVEGEAPKEYIKNPVVTEFMGFRKDTKFDESEMEQALLDNLQQVSPSPRAMLHRHIPPTASA